MKEIKKRIRGLLLRYIIAILISLNSFFIFYLIFTPLTLWPSYALLGIFYTAAVNGNAILIDGNVFLLNEACIAGSAYFLLTLLNLTTPNLRFLRRLKIFLFDASLLLVFNIIRVVSLSCALMSGFAFFDAMHILIWYVLSVLIVVAIWLLTIKIFKIRGIPILSDIAFLGKLIRKNKTGKQRIK